VDLRDETISILAPGGVISRKLPGYEDRPQQIEMAEAVAEAFCQGGHLVVEAGTGVGKSFAYLIPAILFATEAKEPVVVSTNTISLQEQLIDKDIPFLREALPLDFTAVLVKGRGNYVCLRRLNMVATSERGLFETRDEVEEFDRILEWSKITSDGSLADLLPNPPESIWSMICSESDNCLSSKCEFFGRCFYYRARGKVLGADIIVVNHHLLLSDYVLRKMNIGITVLPDYQHLIIDEAHNLESIATAHIGREVTNWRVKRLLDGLYRPPRRSGHPGGVLVRMGAVEHIPLVEEARRSAEIFFDLLSKWLDENETMAIEREGFLPNLLEEPILKLEELLRDLRKRAKDESEEMEITAFIRRCHKLRDDLDDILSLGTEGYVYWVERTGRRFANLSLNAAPITVADELREDFFSNMRTIVATSATLAVNGSFDFFKGRVGLEDARELLIGSPFDYQKQVTLYLHPDMPDPRDESFLDAATAWIAEYLQITHGKAFVLFTSYSMMKAVFERLDPLLEKMGISAFKQGDGLPRSEMLKLFREDTDSVIFGTASFWEGVDVRGEALSNVIIVKLPFSVPDHPIIQARLEQIEKRGGNPFYDYSLPEAVLRLKQGFGRLIRTKTDRGIVVILDPRVLTKSYGKTFLNSLPRCRVMIKGQIK